MAFTVKTVPIADVLRDAALKDSLTACHMAVYNERGEHEWCQAWTEDEAEVDLYVLGRAVHDTTYVTLIQDGDAVVGFSVIAVGRTSQVVTPEEMPPGFKAQEHADGVRRGIERVTVSTNPVIAYYRHLGILKTSRRGYALSAKLITGVEPFFAAPGVEWVGGWTMVKTKLYSILSAKGFVSVYVFPGEEKVYMGLPLTSELRASFLGRGV